MAQTIMVVRQWIRHLTFYEILVGMRATLMVLIQRIVLRSRPAVTLQYPHEKRDLPGTYRGMIALLRYDDESEKCVGCDLCEAACPSRVITVISAEKEGEPMKRYAKEYYMDMTRCIFCGLCIKACPVDALAMTKEYEWSVYNKRDLRLNKPQLLALGDRNFPERERKIEFQHPNVNFFNIGHKDLPVMTSQEPPPVAS
jgi:NADH-quinone oxidoreductase subunit I